MAVEDLYNKACDAVEKGNYDYAIALFREVLRGEPEYPKARMALRVCERRRVAERGSSAIAKALRLVKRLPALLKAVVLSKKPDRALDAYEDFLMDNPSNGPILVRAGLAARKAGLVQASIDILRDAHTLVPGNKTTIRELSELYEEVGQREEALNMMDRLIRLEPENQELRSRFKNLQALQHMERHNIDHSTVGEGRFKDFVRDKGLAEQLEQEQQFTRQSSADLELQKAMESFEKDRENPVKIVRVARLLADRKEYAKAQDVLKEGLKRDQNNYMIRETYGDILLDVLDERIARCEAELKKDPANVELKQKKAELVRKKRAVRIQEYEWRVSQHPTDHHLKLKLGYAYHDVEQIDKAIMAFQQASQDPRLLIDAAAMLGQCFERKHQFDLAIEQYARAIERNPEMNQRGKELHYQLASAYEQAGQREKALELFKKIYSVDISFQDVSKKVETLGRK